MTARPEPHRDQQTIGSWKKTANAAFLLWVKGRAGQPPPQSPLRPTRLLMAAAAAVALAALGVDLPSPPGTP